MPDLYDIEWQSSVPDRYDSDMLAKTDKVVAASGAEVYDRYGGSGATWADNGYTIESEAIEPVLDLAQAVADAAGYPVGVTLFERSEAIILTTLAPAA